MHFGIKITLMEKHLNVTSLNLWVSKHTSNQKWALQMNMEIRKMQLKLEITKEKEKEKERYLLWQRIRLQLRK